MDGPVPDDAVIAHRERVLAAKQTLARAARGCYLLHGRRGVLVVRLNVPGEIA